MDLSLRWRVLQRDRFRCVYCGATAGDAKLQIDHVWPRSRGGRDHITNLVTACQPCNQGKRARVLSQEAEEEIWLRVTATQHVMVRPTETRGPTALADILRNLERRPV